MDNNYIISLQDLFRGRDKEGFDKAAPNEIKLVRHADGRISNPKKESAIELLVDGKKVPEEIGSLYDMYLYRKDLFITYQSEQLKGRFDNVKYIVSFIGENGGTTARFVGVYKICGRHQSLISENEEVLELEEVPEFKFLNEKIVIDWGKATVSWRQNYSQIKYVIRIEDGMRNPNGMPIFKSYNDVILTHDELEQVLKDDEWTNKLKAVNCIYLIADLSNGKHYVGSTYGRAGIYGRWCDYANTGHGDDKDLKKLIEEDSNYHKRNFQWSILETIPLTITEFEAIERESLWKRKLKTIKFGYNNN